MLEPIYTNTQASAKEPAINYSVSITNSLILDDCLWYNSTATSISAFSSKRLVPQQSALPHSKSILGLSSRAPLCVV